MLVFSRIRIEVINFKFSSQTKRHINKDYKVIIKLCILKKIPILKVNITKTKLEKMKIKEKIKDMISFASAAASIVTTKKGAICSMPERREIVDLIDVSRNAIHQF